MRSLRAVVLLIVLAGSSSAFVKWNYAQSYAGQASSEVIKNQPPVVAVSVAPIQASTGDAVNATFFTTDIGGPFPTSPSIGVVARGPISLST